MQENRFKSRPADKEEKEDQGVGGSGVGLWSGEGVVLDNSYTNPFHLLPSGPELEGSEDKKCFPE